MKGFKDFILRGNLVELAVAFIIGAAFGRVVEAFRSKFGEAAIPLVEEQAHLAWMVRERNEDGTLVHWRAPE